MTDAVLDYARRIADSLAHDGVPARISDAEAYRIAERYGVWIPLITEPTVTRTEVAKAISEALSLSALRNAPRV